MSNVKIASSASFSTGSGGPSERTPCVVRPRTGEVFLPRGLLLPPATERLLLVTLAALNRPAVATEAEAEAPPAEVRLWARVWREWCDCDEGDVGAAVVLRVPGERERLSY